ncbi:unnamed protein product [Rotaria sp. Silwood2]|nr:unnamed protein product [Rotaria sp. Silwood2]CAF2593319.1 unnamed protein product [Rotaria sp. Silwood2]CAF2825411.1 unnamed protein product [Rotaria sp. Silwood2]CAF2986512.1 unnamed protein product [Rotaria sp. Silwood2]CAF4117141.1 unnamed protein product [Rotaria sp. Silwood2]
MDSDTLNATRGLVQAILTLTTEQRLSPSVQSLCQYIYCKFSINDQEDNNGTCNVIAARSSLTEEVRQQKHLHFILFVKYIKLYIYPLLIFMGIFGNSLSCFIMFLNVRRNGYSANLYLALLAFVDCLFLLGSALPDWISHVHGELDIKLLSDLCCRFVYWFGNFITHLSAGLVVSITVERFIAIQYPLIAHKINTVKHTHIVLIILITFFFLLDSRVFILVKHLNDSIHIVLTCYNDTYITYERRDILRCSVESEDNRQIWVFIDFAVYTIIPFSIIITLNSLIIHRLIGAQRLRQRMFHPKSKSAKYEEQSSNRNISVSDQIVTEKNRQLRRSRSVPAAILPPIMFRLQKNQHCLRSTMKQSSISIESSLETKIRSHYQYETSLIRQTTNINNMRLTILLLFVSCSFLILTLPAVVVNLIMTTKVKPKLSTFKNNFSLTDDNSNSDTSSYYTIARLLMIVNHSINFILYFVVGKRFRRDLRNLCVSYWRR